MGEHGGLFVGALLGRHRPFPYLSPNKTTEGLCGGLLASILTSIGFYGIREYVKENGTIWGFTFVLPFGSLLHYMVLQ